MERDKKLNTHLSSIPSYKLGNAWEMHSKCIGQERRGLKGWMWLILMFMNEGAMGKRGRQIDAHVLIFF